MNYAGKFGTGELDPLSGGDIGLGTLLSPHGHLSSSGTVHVDKVSTQAPSDAIIVSDANLLFNGDFKRSGPDLVLSNGDRELVLHDYFRGEKRAALASPDGAHLTGDLVNALTGHTQFAQADGSASVAAVIGHVTKLTGNATAIRNGVSIILNQGDNVNKGDVVQSGSDSSLGITFIDGTVFGLASNAKMVLNEMIYDPNGSNNSSLLSLVQGTISFVAGATAKNGDMKVDTPVATMGIRGTAVLVEIDFDVPGQGGAPPAKFQVLVEPDGTTGSYILFDKTTLTPIATVNQAGTQTIVNGQGTVTFLSSAQLSPDAQKIINDVFSLKFTDLNNPKTKLTTNFTDTIVPETSSSSWRATTPPVKLQFDHRSPKGSWTRRHAGRRTQADAHSRPAAERSAAGSAFIERPAHRQCRASTAVRHGQFCRHQSRRQSDRHAQFRLVHLPERAAARRHRVADGGADWPRSRRSKCRLRWCRTPATRISARRPGPTTSPDGALRLPRRRRDPDADLYGAGRQQLRANNETDVQDVHDHDHRHQRQADGGPTGGEVIELIGTGNTADRYHVGHRHLRRRRPD